MERIKTGIAGLDEMLAAVSSAIGQPGRRAPGTGKSTLGMQYIYNGITQFNQPGLILTFEIRAAILRRRGQLRVGFSRRGASGQNRVIMTSPEVSYSDLGGVDGRIQR
jgi:circadian clock protein KaiC